MEQEKKLVVVTKRNREQERKATAPSIPRAAHLPPIPPGLHDLDTARPRGESGGNTSSISWERQEDFFKKLSGLTPQEWSTVTDHHFRRIWRLNDLTNFEARKFMAKQFRVKYAAIMNYQLQLDVLTVQLDLEYPIDSIKELLADLHVIPEVSDQDIHLIPDLFATWRELCNTVSEAHSEHFSTMIDTLHSDEGKSELKLWGRATGAVNAWSMHQERYENLIVKVNELAGDVTERRKSWKDFQAKGGTKRRRKSSRLRGRKRQ